MKLDLILENVRNKYSLGLLEESEGLDEKQVLQGKILINESTMAIRDMLVENGVLDSVKTYLEEAWTDAVMQAADDTYEGAADFVGRVGDGFSGAAKGAALGAGLAANSDIEPGTRVLAGAATPVLAGVGAYGGYKGDGGLNDNTIADHYAAGQTGNAYPIMSDESKFARNAALGLGAAGLGAYGALKAAPYVRRATPQMRKATNNIKAKFTR